MLLLTTDNGTVGTKKYANTTQRCCAVLRCKLSVTEGHTEFTKKKKTAVLPRHHLLGMPQELHSNIAVNCILKQENFTKISLKIRT
jgi:hypothetical protein